LEIRTRDGAAGGTRHPRDLLAAVHASGAARPELQGEWLSTPVAVDGVDTESKVLQSMGKGVLRRGARSSCVEHGIPCRERQAVG